MYLLIYKYNYIFLDSQTFNQERFFGSMKKVTKRLSRNSCVIHGYIRIYESARKDRIRSEGVSIPQAYQAVRYMDINTHGSVPYQYRICTYRVHTYTRRNQFPNLTEETTLVNFVVPAYILLLK